MIFSTKQLNLLVLCTFLGFGEMGLNQLNEVNRGSSNQSKMIHHWMWCFVCLNLKHI